MKIVTIGMSPYHLSARGKLNSWILQYLYAKQFSITSIVHHFDPNYFPPDEHGRHFYKFTNSGSEHGIQILPFVRNGQETIPIYEMLNALEPDLVIGIGDLSEFWFLKAIKSFVNRPFQCLLVATGYSLPLQSDMVEILDDFDAILCVNKLIYNEIQSIGYSNILEHNYVGCNQKIYTNIDANTKLRISTICKNTQVDNLPVVLQAFKDVENQFSSLYIHTNRHSAGDYNINELLHRFQLNEDQIEFPPKFISDNDGLSDAEFANELKSSDIFIASHIVSSTAMSVFQALFSGCWVIMPDYGIYKEIAQEIENASNGSIKSDRILVKGLKFISTGGSEIFIMDRQDLTLRIREYLEFRQKYKGVLNTTIECLREYSNNRFLAKVLELIISMHGQKSVLKLEELVNG